MSWTPRVVQRCTARRTVSQPDEPDGRRVMRRSNRMIGMDRMEAGRWQWTTQLTTAWPSSR
ncbi:hypothetical protein BN2475_190269 [Paraburkholderia ribeironis]|uniref:Uncharacterized protein n=1 Tax=Paraburkholderia ribeironis TaxID=1247936 RepID=A0A1N7RWJ0_9BURK|nr:hypothetical protein BN2475_190269 [Paraburkholderia ribeironis]